METLDEALRARDEVAGPDEGRPSLSSTTGPSVSSTTWAHAANAELIARNDRRGRPAGALRLDVEAPAPSQQGGTAARAAAAAGR